MGEAVKENKRIRRTQLLRWTATLAFFLVINCLRVLLLPINQAEYTDGVIQVTQFSNPTGIYPPLYTAIVWPFSLIFGQLWSGRLVSTAFSILGVIPIYHLAQRTFGMRPAIFAALIYTVAPTCLRWSPRVMTEATFCFFFWYACERIVAAQGAKTLELANKALAMAGVFTALAAMTRYQGMALVLPVIATAGWLYYKRGFLPWRGTLTLALCSFVVLWSRYAGNVHGDQFEERTKTLGAIGTFLYNAEPFLLLMPYFLTYPVAALVFIGLDKGRARPGHAMLPITLYVFVVLLVAQSLFSSFQERYFLPFFGLLYIWGGVGMAIVDDRLRRHQLGRLRPWVPIVVVVWSLFISMLVLLGSRQAWGDIKKAAVFAAKEAKTSPGIKIYSNEVYPAAKNNFAFKAQFFAKHSVESLDQNILTGRAPLEPGDLIILSDAYGAQAIEPMLRALYPIEQVATFKSTITPVFPDLMSDGTDQKPEAWNHRYWPQEFNTTVWRIGGKK